jgi:hypothetical protein
MPLAVSVTAAAAVSASEATPEGSCSATRQLVARTKREPIDVTSIRQTVTARDSGAGRRSHAQRFARPADPTPSPPGSSDPGLACSSGAPAGQHRHASSGVAPARPSDRPRTFAGGSRAGPSTESSSSGAFKGPMRRERRASVGTARTAAGTASTDGAGSPPDPAAPTTSGRAGTDPARSSAGVEAASPTGSGTAPSCHGAAGMPPGDGGSLVPFADCRPLQPGVRLRHRRGPSGHPTIESTHDRGSGTEPNGYPAARTA